SNDYKTKQYTNYFPTVNLGYEFTKDHSITLGLNRRIRRPRSWFLNPFPSRSSVTNIFQGNPDLDPVISTAVDLGYLTKSGSFTFNGSVYYQHATDVFSFVSMPTGETVNMGGTDIPVIKRMPINLSTNDRYGGEMTVNYRVGRKFNANANINLFKSVTKGTYQNQVFDADNFSWFARLNAKYTLPADITWQTRLFYRGPRETAQGNRKAMFSTSMAFSKDVFKNKGTLSLNISDLFNTRKFSMETLTDNYYSTNEYQWRKRSISLSFTYRFNQKKQQRRRQGNYNGGGGDDMEFPG
ncbi:MAG TPA: TonB-dependent receptor, partial [Flavobacteriales bacterium]|nr:TonB-dependent receptor [Flavobacteriales bacterium]